MRCYTGITLRQELQMWSYNYELTDMRDTSFKEHSERRFDRTGRSESVLLVVSETMLSGFHTSWFWFLRHYT